MKRHPKTATFIVEVADTTLEYDRTTKAGIYARAGVEEYWIVNLPDRVLEVYRQPAPMTGKPLGYSYRTVTLHAANETVSPMAASEQAISVADLLP